MLTREEWDMIARCVHSHPPSITTEEANDLIKKLSETTPPELRKIEFNFTIISSSNTSAVKEETGGITFQLPSIRKTA